MTQIQPKSHWMTTRDYVPGKSLQGEIDADVAIIGGGYTGLSTAYHLKKEDPGLKIVLLESEIIGYGASGRNGGFNMTLFGPTLSEHYGPAVRQGKGQRGPSLHGKIRGPSKTPG
ncbi:MAG: FAD-dependent oxidoreductase [Desulfobacter sp.]|nr:MAG: FAD-dependent oxidoreductase [Desulfobacter sp.]